MSNLIIIPKKNGYLVRNQINNREIAVFKTKQDAQLFIRNYKMGKINIHSHNHGYDHNNYIYGVQSNVGSIPMYSQQYSATVYPPNMMYPQQYSATVYPPNMMYPQQYSATVYPPNMMYPQQFPTQPYNTNIINGYGIQSNLANSSMNLKCECGYIYNNEYEAEMNDEEEGLLGFETDDNPELIKPPEISEMNKTLDEQKPKVSEAVEQIQEEPIFVKEPTIMMSDLTNFSIENDEELNNNNLSKKELKNLKKQQKKELKLIKKQEKRNNHIYDEMEDYLF